MAIWAQIAVSIILNIVSSLLMAAAAPKPKAPEAGKLDVPKAEEGESITEIFGTILVKDPTVVWFGGQYTVAIRKKGGKK